jgi:hypothetical protein
MLLPLSVRWALLSPLPSRSTWRDLAIISSASSGKAADNRWIPYAIPYGIHALYNRVVPDEHCPCEHSEENLSATGHP